MQAQIVAEKVEAKEQPILVSFPNGAPFKYSQMEFDLHQATAVSSDEFGREENGILGRDVWVNMLELQDRRKRQRQVYAEKDNVVYNGKNFGEHAAARDTSTFYMGVYDPVGASEHVLIFPIACACIFHCNHIFTCMARGSMS